MITHRTVFPCAMVKKILHDQKWQMRRFLPVPDTLDGTRAYPHKSLGAVCLTAPRRATYGVWEPICSKYSVGDLLWVGERWHVPGLARYMSPAQQAAKATRNQVIYAASNDDAKKKHEGRWQRASHMPRVFSRLTLLVTAVRIERLQDISEEDAEAEGAPKYDASGTYRTGFAGLWDSTNGDREGAAWDDNPWVVAISFETIRENVDTVLAKEAA